MKILKLSLKNFSHIYSGLGKYEISLDFSNNNKMINVIIGKMGTCKTVILGHLQPFASFGTLDVRNQDDIIIPEYDGEKNIIYKLGTDIYNITHTYTWNKTSHTIKSSIEKNGLELNPNGNQSSFKLIILNEFGIEQDFLRLIRLGANVANIINMKSTERKSFMASLLKDAEIYMFLYKKLTEDMRKLNTQTSVLTNKLNHLGVNNESVLQDEYDLNVDDIRSLTAQKETIGQSIFTAKAKIDAMLKGNSVDNYRRTCNDIESKLQERKEYYSELENKLEHFSNVPPITEISKLIGGLDASLLQNNEKLTTLESQYNTLSNTLTVLTDTYRVSQNKDHIEELQLTYDELVSKADKSSKELEFFNCEYSVTFITSLLGDLNTINILIEEISQYKTEIIIKLFKSDHSVLAWARKQLEFIDIKKMKLQKDINNIKYSEKYEAPSTLYLPPMCPTKTCPYFKTHPFNIKQNISDTGPDTQLVDLQSKLGKLESESYMYSDYPYIYSKLTTLKALWRKVQPILLKLKVIKTQSLLQILTNLESRVWYDYDAIINTIELCEKRDSYNSLIESLNRMKTELLSYKIHENESIESQMRMTREEMDSIVSEISQVEENIKNITVQIKDYNQLYLELSQVSVYEKDKQEVSFEIGNMSSLLNEYKMNLMKISEEESILQHLYLNMAEISSKLESLINKNDNIRTILNDLKYTKEEFKSVFDAKETLKYILDAVSSKEGIPLKMVELFLTDSKDVLNDLISDVFDESLEILKFNITENDFLIPYAINGTAVKDIERASQGQKAIISLALSFALVQQSPIEYNIMLLDELDGPLYKHDRERFLNILFKQLSAINAEQVFLISHNNTFDGYPVNIIMTSDEVVDKTAINTIMKV